jgi:hypothetical protein
MGFFDEFKRGYSGDDSRRYRVTGVLVRCPHCGGEDFDEGAAMLNTAGATLLGLDWANRSANLLICVKCSRIEWFLEKPARMASQTTAGQ